MKRIFTKVMMLTLMLVSGVASVSALETYDFQTLSLALRTLNGNGGPWAVTDGGDAGFTLGTEEAPAVMHFLGDYTDQGFSWNQRFAYEFVDGRGKFTFRSKSASKDKNCGMFSWDYNHKFSILNLKDGDKVTITTLAGTTSFVSTNVTAEVNAGDAVASGTAYTISTTEESTRLDINMAAATLISKIEIEPYGVETVPVITVTPQTLKLIPGATAKLTANVSPAAETTWTSSDEAVATVAEDGTVTAVAAGEATITNKWASTVSDATAEASCVITVAAVDLSAYTVVKAYDFTTMGDVTLEINTENVAGSFYNAANNKNNDAYWCTNEGLDFLAVQAVAVARNGRGWLIDNQLENHGGLYMASGAGRCAAIGGIKAGQIVEFIYTGNGFYTKSDGSDDGIEKDALNEGTGRAIYLAKEDGMIGFELDKANAVQQINVYELPASTYTVAGNSAAIFGTEWDAQNTANDMELVNGIYTKTYEGVELTNDYEVEYKVVKDHSWEVNYGDNGNNATYKVWEGDGKYDVTFTFNPETEAVACSMTKVIPSTEPVYYLVGNMNNWTQSADYVLTLNEAAEGVEYMITLDLEADAEFKVNTGEDENIIWYPANAANCTVNTAGQYTVYFRPNADGGDDWYYNVLNPVRIGESTGINAIQAEKLNGAVVYNLNGQRVLNAQKGLYIVNGRKVVVK
ncbi:MAG: Ig-like domain-containing protein [Prevotella sp.]|nr:Ig-like domain-containing protein [Prevotella sp.]